MFQIFENRHSYLSHVDTHRDNERRLVYECPVCHKTDRSEDVLTGHIQTVHLTSEQTGQNVGAQDCEICGEAFSSRSKLKRKTSVLLFDAIAFHNFLFGRDLFIFLKYEGMLYCIHLI